MEHQGCMILCEGHEEDDSSYYQGYFVRNDTLVESLANALNQEVAPRYGFERTLIVPKELWDIPNWQVSNAETTGGKFV